MVTIKLWFQVDEQVIWARGISYLTVLTWRAAEAGYQSFAYQSLFVSACLQAREPTVLPFNLKCSDTSEHELVNMRFPVVSASLSAAMPATGGHQ